ncbi:unnamed protein product [Durusdinium trenchii]|uniref:Uncharacterized protein n=1 Tax=Durusdinium trenchii TaxID=1381693 RepID=A0ABP0RU27_9DINO
MAALATLFCGCRLPDDCRTAQKSKPDRISPATSAQCRTKSLGSSRSSQCTPRCTSKAHHCQEDEAQHLQQRHVNVSDINQEVWRIVKNFKGGKPVVTQISDAEYEVNGRRIRLLAPANSRMLVKEDCGIESQVSFETYLAQVGIKYEVLVNQDISICL